MAAVRGNNDWDAELPYGRELEFAGKRFFLTHGHLSDVNHRLDGILAQAQSVGADAVLYGHTHRAYWEEIGGLLVLNPGSLSRPRDAGGPSFATIGVPQNGWFEIRQWRLERDWTGKRRPVPRGQLG